MVCPQAERGHPEGERDCGDDWFRERESEREYGMKGLKRQRGEGENQEGLRRSERAFLDGTGHSVMTLIS